jgi:hypothetical protein
VEGTPTNGVPELARVCWNGSDRRGLRAISLAIQLLLEALVVAKYHLVAHGPRIPFPALHPSLPYPSVAFA